MEIYLVRHTETVCEKGICYGQSDVAIRAPFEDVFQNIINLLPEEAVLYSSPLQRCTILAQYIQRNKNYASIKEDNRLMEMNFGNWELQKWEDIPQDVLNPWMEDFVSTAVPNGESFLDLHNRVHDFFENELDQKSEKPIIVVCHSGVMRSVLCKINNIPLVDAFKSKLDFGEVIKIVV